MVALVSPWHAESPSRLLGDTETEWPEAPAEPIDHSRLPTASRNFRIGRNLTGRSWPAEKHGVKYAALKRIPYQVGLVGLALCVAGLTLLVKNLDPSIVPNLATGSKVTASSLLSPHNHVERLIDGDPWQIGIHTTHETNPWILLELPEPKMVSRIIVYNRVDCCQELAAPMTLEVSLDGQVYRKVAENPEAFEKWKVDISPRTVRFLRIQTHRTGPLHLNEIEVL